MNLVLRPGLRLSGIVPCDKPAILKHLAEPSIARWTSRIGFPYREADADQWLSYLQGRRAANGGRDVVWAIRNEADEMIGAIGLDNLQIGISFRAELGYWLAQTERGRGVMSAAVAGLCDYAFEHLGLVKIYAHAYPDNLASCRVLEKCGFQREGLLRSHIRKDGRYFDAVAYGRLGSPPVDGPDRRLYQS
jgi:RimJ/RimL family protein N-acetyltransferase